METATPSLEQLLEHTRAELDELATEAGVEDAGSLPNKQAVAEAIVAAQEPPVPVYTLELLPEYHHASFHYDGAEVELDDDNRVYETTSAHLYRELLALPFLHDPNAPVDVDVVDRADEEAGS